MVSTRQRTSLNSLNPYHTMVDEQQPLSNSDNIINCRDSGDIVYRVDQIDEDHASCRARSTVALDGSIADPSVNSQIKLSTLKRRSTDVHLDQPISIKKIKKAIPKRNRKPGTLTDKGKLRVGCPFYKHDPSQYGDALSCRSGKGWNEPGKLKDHLKSVHKLSVDWLTRNLWFKEGGSRVPIEAHWRLAYQKLFPHVPKDEIPSPWMIESNNAGEIAAPAISLGDLRDHFRAIILDCYRIDILCDIPNLEVEFDVMFDEAVQNCKNGISVMQPEVCEYMAVDIKSFTAEIDSHTHENCDPSDSALHMGFRPQSGASYLQDLTGLPMDQGSLARPVHELSPSIKHEVEDEHDKSDVVPNLKLEYTEHTLIDVLELRDDSLDHSNSTAFEDSFNLAQESQVHSHEFTAAELDNPSTGFEIEANGSLSWFPEFNPTELSSHSSEYLIDVNDDFELDMWLQSDTYAPIGEWSVDQTRGMSDLADRML